MGRIPGEEKEMLVALGSSQEAVGSCMGPPRSLQGDLSALCYKDQK